MSNNQPHPLSVQAEVNDIVSSALRLPRDLNGNSRWLVPAEAFIDRKGNEYRPRFATKYRGKHVANSPSGRGFVFQTVTLARDILQAYYEGDAA